MSEKMGWEGGSDWSRVEPTNNIFFNCGNAANPVLVLDKDGMIYKGQRIEDAGEAHRAFLETMKMMKERG